MESLFLSKADREKERMQSERKTVARFRNFSEQDKSNGHAVMSHYRENRKNEKKESIFPVKELEISTGTNADFCLGYSEEKKDILLTFRQRANLESAYPFSHHRQMEEGAEKKLRKAHHPQNAAASLKQEDSFAVAAMRFDPSVSSVKISKQYQSILSHEEGRNTAAEKVIGSVPEKKEMEKQLSKRLVKLRAGKKGSASKDLAQEERVLESELASLRREMQMEKQLNAKMERAIRSGVDAMQKQKEKKGASDWLMDILKWRLLEEEEGLFLKPEAAENKSSKKKSSREKGSKEKSKSSKTQKIKAKNLKERRD